MEKFKHVPNLVNDSECYRLTKHLFNISQQHRTVTDQQCPSSEAVYSDPAFDKLLEDLLPKMEEITGKKLYPTYSYARIYKKGERLLPHTDRPACEISATITLGSSHNRSWPIFMALPGEKGDQAVVGENDEIIRVKDTERLEINDGDAIVYAGMVMPHWRETLQDDWQTQVFVHYVDANGQYAGEKYDKRPKLSHHTADQVVEEQPQVQDRSNSQAHYWLFENAISKNSCQQMIEKFESVGLEKAFVGDEHQNSIDLNIRDANKLQIPFDIGIGATLTGMGMSANRQAWNFDIKGANQSEFLSYSADGHYNLHTDTFLDPSLHDCRKLTVLAFLNDDFEGGKLYLLNGEEKMYPAQTAGNVIIFPSFIPHCVEPVTKGTRRTIVTWMVGPWFK